MGKAFVIATAIVVASLIGFAIFVIQLWFLWFNYSVAPVQTLSAGGLLAQRAARRAFMVHGLRWSAETRKKPPLGLFSGGLVSPGVSYDHRDPNAG